MAAVSTCAPGLLATVDEIASGAFERYCRLNYLTARSLAWPSQRLGIEALTEKRSFALCTPTGSGKTAIAELAILKHLSGEQILGESGPIALYLAPTRALCAEVESRLANVLPKVCPGLTVTGLYGGTDWGPTDAWLTSPESRVLVCTHEKGEALIRFLGPLFLPRVALLVIDEAHMVEFGGQDVARFSGDERSLRLELLAARLFAYLDPAGVGVIALSAVARAQGTLARWVGNDESAQPVGSSQRSMRQLIGRMECRDDKSVEFRYDLLDGSPLRLVGRGTEQPYVPRPFPPYPPLVNDYTGPEQSMRPYVIWAAMQLAKRGENGEAKAVLVSVNQNLAWYAESILQLLDEDWRSAELPVVFSKPENGEKAVRWLRCLACCFDYFGESSREYRLLKRGIALHHGKMPSLLARFLSDVIRDGTTNLVFATSTLSEGVNLPFDTILLPSVMRGQTPLTTSAFANVAGRAGRPGTGTEGRCFVALKEHGSSRDRFQYERIVRELGAGSRSSADDTTGISPLACLLQSIFDQWKTISGSRDQDRFIQWLESVSTEEGGAGQTAGNDARPEASVDVLDTVLLASIVELEIAGAEELSPARLEERLQQIWKRTYAHFVAQTASPLERIFLRRGNALAFRIYPDKVVRRRLYKTSLPPNQGRALLRVLPEIIAELKRGTEFASWGDEERLNWIRDCVLKVSSHPKFQLAPKVGRRLADWRAILRWWLAPGFDQASPGPGEIAAWHEYAATNFSYKFCWALGAVVSLYLDELSAGELRPMTLDAWSEADLPWSAFWLKELMVWGTLDPVSAYVLAKGYAWTRPDAKQFAARYATDAGIIAASDRGLDPRLIAGWLDRWRPNDTSAEPDIPNRTYSVELARDFSQTAQNMFRVLPLETEGDILWMDAAGYALARSARPDVWQADAFSAIDFELDTHRRVVEATPYL